MQDVFRAEDAVLDGSRFPLTRMQAVCILILLREACLHGLQDVFRTEDAVLDGSRFQQLDELLSKTDLYTKFLRFGWRLHGTAFAQCSSCAQCLSASLRQACCARAPAAPSPCMHA